MSRLCGRPPGEVEGVLRVPRVWWSQALQWNETKTRLALGELERAGLVQRLGETADDAFLRVTRRDFPREALQRIAVDLGRQREERYRRLDEITAYCKTTTCRRCAVLQYFGDPDQPLHHRVERGSDCGFAADVDMPVRGIEAA